MKPLQRRELIRKLQALGFSGPEQRGRHPFMTRGKQKLHIPGEHRREVTPSLQLEILRQAGITKQEWEKA